MLQEPIESCSVTYMLGIRYTSVKMSAKYLIWSNLDRFLKADPTSGKFSLKTYDVASTHPSWVMEQRHRSFGKCYTIHPDEKTR